MSTSGAGSRAAGGIALLVVAGGLGFFEVQKVAGQADRDVAFCGSSIQSPECQVLPRPITVTWTKSSDTDFQTLYDVDVLTGRHTTFFLTGLNDADVAPLRGQSSIEVQYRNGRPLAVIWPDGTPIRIPFALTHDFWMTILAALTIGVVGGSLLLWGIVRTARGPRTGAYAY